MKKVIFILSLLLLVGCAVFAQTVQLHTDSLYKVLDINENKINMVDERLEQVSKRFDNLEYAVDKLKDIIAQEQSAIENSLASSSLQLDIFALIITLGGIFLGWYVSRKKKAVQNLLDEVTRKQEEIIILKNDVEEKKKEIIKTGEKVSDLNKEINENVEGLYARLRQEETTTLLKRLVEVPEDISNLSSLLLSRPLLPNDFKILLEAYENLLKENPAEKMRYILLFFQHFCGQSIKTDLLRQDIIDFFPHGLECAFKQDVTNSLSSLIEVLNNTTIEGGNENVLAKYIKALNKSRHKKYHETYQIIISKCKATINLQTVWNNLADENVIIEPFGNLLCDKYKEDQEFVKKVQEQIASIKENDEHKDVKSSKKEEKEEV